MFKKLIYFVLLSTTLSGCFIADDFFLPKEEEPNELSLQERSETAVRKYVDSQKGDQRYDIYGFGQLKIIKPLELQRLDQLKAKTATTEVSAEIDSLEKFIRRNKIERSVELDHFFTMKDDLSSEKIQVLESRFTLNDTLGIKKFEPLIILEIDREMEDVLVYYFHEYTIFLAETYQSSKDLSKKFYAFFKSRLEEIQGVEAKSAFLEHTLDLCAWVKKNGSFEPRDVLAQKVGDYLQEERPDITDYQSIQFSTLFEQSNEQVETSGAPEGYYFFHKFIGSYENKIDTSVVLVEFSKYYELDKIYQMERPFDRYFKN